MTNVKELQLRSGSSCELCGSKEALSEYPVPDSPNVGMDALVYICKTCIDQIENTEQTDPNHWRCLNDSMWSQVPGVQVLAWRMLTRLRSEGWPQDLLDILYLEDDMLQWAKSSGEGNDETKIIHKDTNGAVLLGGDSVVLIKDLDVKGANFIAKRGTTVKNISLVHDNPDHIEGKVKSQHIVILTKFVKKA